MNILHDFNLGLHHFTIPLILFDEIKRRNFNITDYQIATKSEKNKCEIFFGNRIRTTDLSLMPKLKYIHLGCVGYNNLDLEILKAKNIKLTNSSDIVEEAMAETTLATIMWFNKSFNLLNKIDNLSREYFNKYYDIFKPMNQLKFLVFGYGKVSKQFIKMASNFTTNISVVVRNPSKCRYEGNIIKITEVLNNIHSYDYIINCLPLNSSSKNYFNKIIFNEMNQKSVYINIGRSGTTVFDDLMYFVKNDKIRGAFLDVYEIDDITKNEIITDSRFIISPHISGWTTEYWNDQSRLLLSNLDSFKEGNYNQLINQIV